MHPQPASDGALAYWPPGYALFLAPFLALLPGAAAVLLFALWPNLVSASATPEKEMLVAACLIWAVLALLGPGRCGCYWRAVLYRANNPLATGGYTERGAIDVSALPELAQDRTAKALALDWISSHPARFAQLLVEKQVRFMGDGGFGVYTSFRVQGSGRDGALYGVLKLLANAWWLAAWLLVAALLCAGRRLGAANGRSPIASMAPAPTQPAQEVPGATLTPNSASSQQSAKLPRDFGRYLGAYHDHYF